MTWNEYIEDKIIPILIQLSFLYLVMILLIFCGINIIFSITSGIILSSIYFLFLTFDYHIKKRKSQELIDLVDSLEEKYLITEMLKKPKNLENSAYYYALKKSCKAMNDKLTSIEKEEQAYHEYIESFVHEIKTPIAALFLYYDNKKDFKAKQELLKIDNLVEQILYYARSDNTEKDYFIKKIKLTDIIHPILLTYREYLLEQKIVLEIDNLDLDVYTDEKWIQFMIGQILQNSIKYSTNKNRKIKIMAQIKKDKIILSLKDNGIGILPEDLPRVFNKGFTGSNRKNTQATGMGLYLSKKLADRLHLKLEIISKVNEGTECLITFSKMNLYEQLVSSNSDKKDL